LFRCHAKATGSIPVSLYFFLFLRVFLFIFIKEDKLFKDGKAETGD
jgi:hypothetical protein